MVNNSHMDSKVMVNLPVMDNNRIHLRETVNLTLRKAVTEHHNKTTEVHHQTTMVTTLHLSILTIRLKKRRRIAQFRKLLVHL
jgi:hypothetical protein